MTDRERFEVILEEVGSLLDRIGWLCDVVLIGAQALAAEQVAAGEDPLLQVETDTGQRIVRGYSLEPDLLIDTVDPEESARWDEFPEILRSCGYQRGGRAFQWEKQIGDVYVRLDLFRPEGTPTQATPMTELPRGDRVLARASELRFRVRARDVKLKTPNAVDFVLMKLDAMRIRGPKNPKDAFDLYAYVRKKTPAAVGELIAAARERDEALQRLHEVFADENAPGILDVLSFAGSLEGIDRELVVRDVVRTFAELRRLALAAPGSSSR
jgi:hypothetical protein